MNCPILFHHFPQKTGSSFLLSSLWQRAICRDPLCFVSGVSTLLLPKLRDRSLACWKLSELALPQTASCFGNCPFPRTRSQPSRLCAVFCTVQSQHNLSIRLPSSNLRSTHFGFPFHATFA
jgi:hypothetical protein